MAAGPTVVVVAAGRGSRFGGAVHKLAQPLGASTVLGHTLRQVLASRLALIVVSTPWLADLARQSVASRDVLVLPQDQNAPQAIGMGLSIAAGVSARPQAGSWLVLPADMPLVAPTTIRAVAAALAQHALVYPQFQGRRGHPVGFGGELYSELIALTGDEGAKRLLARYPAFALPVDDAGVLVDVDTPEDLAKVRASIKLPAATSYRA